MGKPEVKRAHEPIPKDLENLKKEATVDTLHNDEALKVLATYAGDEQWELSEEKKLVRKLDRRLLSLLCTTYGLQYYDKAMLSQAVSCLSFLLAIIIFWLFYISRPFSNYPRTGPSLSASSTSSSKHTL
jgi:hypothetical protein